MREQDHLIGVKRAIPDARGNWSPLPAYAGWTPKPEPRLSSWWLVAGAVLATLAALGFGL